MKKILVLLLMGVSCAAVALDKPQLEQQAQRLLVKFQSLQDKPGKRVPADVLAKAKGVILLDRTKAGFVFAYQGGGGIAIAKDKKGNWGPISFMQASEASLGFQIGGQKSFLVILLMTDESVRSLVADSDFEFGGEARGTAGDATSGAEGTVSSLERSVIIYDDRQGLYGGAAIKGGALSPNHDANLAYYGEPVTVKDILFENKVKPTGTALKLGEKLTQHSKKAG